MADLYGKMNATLFLLVHVELLRETKTENVNVG